MINRMLLIFVFILCLSNVGYSEVPVIWTDCIKKDSWEKKVVLKQIYDDIKYNLDEGEDMDSYTDKLCIKISKSDLNSDGIMEIVYTIDHEDFCWRGCEFGVIVKLNKKFKKVISFMCDSEISISQHKTNSYFDIILPTNKTLIWKNNKYNFKE